MGRQSLPRRCTGFFTDALPITGRDAQAVARDRAGGPFPNGSRKAASTLIMWTCPQCGEQHEDTFDSCWKCAGLSTAPGAATPPPADPLRCPRCPSALDFVGTKKFHEGTHWGVLGELGELFVNRESFDIYVCPRCGRVEFFVDGIGEEFRPR